MTTRRIALSTSVILAALAFSGCTVTPLPRGGSCRSGAICDCPDGSAGTQSCFTDGSYDACLCSVTATPIYESCATVDECEALADRCQSVTITYADTGTFMGAHCTNGCVTDADCVTGSTGEAGACYTILGLPNAVCYERCFDDLDCASGYRCVDATDEVGNPLGDSICLPG